MKQQRIQNIEIRDGHEPVVEVRLDGVMAQLGEGRALLVGIRGNGLHFTLADMPPEPPRVQVYLDDVIPNGMSTLIGKFGK